MSKAALKAKILALAAAKQPDLKGMALNEWAAQNVVSLKAELSANSQSLSTLRVEPEVIPRPGDPGFTAAIILQLIECEGNLEAALRVMDCTFGDYLAVASTAEFKTAYDNIIAAKVDIPNRLAVRLALTEAAKEGNGYVAKVLHDTRQGTPISEEEQRALAELRVADRRTLGRQLEAGIKRMVGMLEVVRGRRYSLMEHEADGHEPSLIEPTAADIAADVAQPYVEDDPPPDGE